MRSCLSWEGWLDHDNLPPKWKYKKTNKSSHKISVLSDRGTHFTTHKMCFDYMEQEEYDQRIIEGFNIFAKQELTKGGRRSKIKTKELFENDEEIGIKTEQKTKELFENDEEI